MFEKTSNTVATRKAGTFLCVHGYSELKNSWKLRIEITNKSSCINTTRYSYSISIAAISHRSNHASNPLPLRTHEFLKTGADDDDASVFAKLGAVGTDQ